MAEGSDLKEDPCADPRLIERRVCAAFTLAMLSLSALSVSAQEKKLIWETSIENAYLRQAVIDPINIPRGNWEWIPIEPITEKSIERLRQRFPSIRTVEYAQPYGSRTYTSEKRKALTKYLGLPLEPDGSVIPGAPLRGHWWISKLNGRLQGIVLIVDADSGDVFYSHAPPKGNPVVWMANVGTFAFNAAIRVANRLVKARRSTD